MAEHVGDNYTNYSWTGGGYGNLIAGDVCKHELAAVIQNDTVQLMRLPVGTVLIGFIAVWDALGANTVIKLSTRVGTTITDRVTAIGTVTSAGSAFLAIEPVTIATESDLIATQTGAGTGAGTLSVVPLYINRGN